MSTPPFTAPLPPPVQPKEISSPPRGEDWSYEFLWSGERVRAIKEGENVRLLARDGRSLGNRFSRVAAAVAKIRAEHAVIDGEILQLEGYSSEAIAYLSGVSDEVVQSKVVLLAYDLLQVDGTDMREMPLLGRRVMLAAMLQGAPIVLSPLRAGSSDEALRTAARLGLRGIVAKRAGSSYRPNALVAPWVKIMLPTAV
ncbi:MAG: hypothetical protein V4773_19665 [Verrucomicrobiota bacterium]